MTPLLLRTFVAFVLASSAFAQATTRVTVTSLGAQSNGHSLGPGAISASGSVVGYTSNASNLVPNDTNGFADAFVHVRATGVTERVSVSSAGVQGNFASNDATPSTDGRWVAFVSTATNLVAGDVNAHDDIFVRDRQTGTTLLVSVSSAGTRANSDSYYHAISVDGTCVAFVSDASNLVAGDTNSAEDVFVRDLVAGTTLRVSVDSSGAQGNGFSTSPAISGDGRFVAFASIATNLVAGDTNGVRDAFVHDRQTGVTTRVSLGAGGVQANAVSCVSAFDAPRMSADGRYVVFESDATNLVAGDTNGLGDVFLRDLTTGTTVRASLDSAGVQGNGQSRFAAVSDDGRFVAFTSGASNLVPGDTNGRHDVFVRDVLSGATARVSVSTSGGQGDGSSAASLPSSITADGRAIAFDSGSTNLVAGDTNNAWDVFVHDRGSVPLAYCTAGTSSNGCAPVLVAGSNPDVAHAGSCTLAVAGLDGQCNGILFYGLTALAQPWCGVGGASWLCVKSPLERTPTQSSGGTLGACNGMFALDWNAFQLSHPSALGAPWNAGSKAHVQAWYRDPLSCKTTSLTAAAELTYQP